MHNKFCFSFYYDIILKFMHNIVFIIVCVNKNYIFIFKGHSEVMPQSGVQTYKMNKLTNGLLKKGSLLAHINKVKYILH